MPHPLLYGTSGQGRVYQGRFKSFPMQDDEHFFVVARYIERNAVRANLVERADDWQWGSLARQARSRSKNAASLVSRSASQLGHAC